MIHKVNDRISITRDKPDLKMPYLLMPYYWAGRDARLFRTAVEPGTVETDTVVPNNGANQTLGWGVFVGDGYFLCMERRADGKAARPLLVNIQNTTQPFVDSWDHDANIPGANVRFNTEWLMDSVSEVHDGEIFPSYMATGWRDSERRYGFAVFGVLDDGEASVWASRYVCIVGDTGTRTATMHFLPTRPNSAVPLMRSPPGLFNTPAVLEYKTSWWGSEAIYGSPGYRTFDSVSSARCYCVGPGHLLTLLVPQERFMTHTDVFGASSTPMTVGAISPSWLPAGSAPYLLRSRDFGETWSMEKADFLVEDEPPTEDSIFNFFRAPGPGADWWNTFPNPPTDPGPLQRIGRFSYFIASPIGAGRVAIAALGKYAGVIHKDETLAREDYPFLSVSGRAWNFYVSGTSGSGFTKKWWPMQAMRADEPNITFDYAYVDTMPKQRTFEVPVFNPWSPSPRAYSFAPGHFIWASISYGVDTTTSSYDWGNYPQDYQVTVWVTYDYGDTWVPSAMPSKLLPHASDLGEYYRGYPKPSDFQKSDMWAARTITFGSIAPEYEDDKPTVTYMRANFSGTIEIYASEDFKDPIGSLSYASGIYATPGAPYLIKELTLREWQAANVIEVFYTGDLLSRRYPELVRPGYKEFEEPTT